MNIYGGYPGEVLKKLKVEGDATIEGDLTVDGKITGTLDLDRVRTDDGTETEPAYSYKLDTGTGFYRSGSGEVSYSSGGTKRVRLAGTDAEYSVPVKAPSYSFTSSTTSTLSYNTTSSTVDVKVAGSTIGQFTPTMFHVGTNAMSTTSTNTFQIKSGESGFDGPNSAFTYNAYFDFGTSQWRNIAPGRGGFVKHTSSGDYIVSMSTNSPATADQILTLINYIKVTSSGAMTLVGTLGVPSVQCTSLQTQTMTSSIISCSNITATTMTCSSITSTSVSATTTTTDTLNVNTLNYSTQAYWRGGLDDTKITFSGGFEFWPITTSPYDSTDISPNSPFVKISSEGWYVITAKGLSDLSSDGTFRYIYIISTSSGSLGSGSTPRYTSTEPIFFSATAVCYLQSGDNVGVQLYVDTTNTIVFVGGIIEIKRILL